MSEQKINLEELFDQYFINDCDEIYDAKYDIIEFTKQFGKQLLELAAENASIIKNGTVYPNGYFEINKERPYAPSFKAYVYKQSILDTIKQVE